MNRNGAGFHGCRIFVGFNLERRVMKRRIPNWLLCFVGTVFWRVGKVRNWIFPEIERRRPAVFLGTWRGHVIVKSK